MTSTNGPGQDPADRARRAAVDARFSVDLDRIEAADVTVRAAEAERTREIIQAVDDVETLIAPVIGTEFAHRNLVAEIALALRISEMAAGTLVSTATVARALPASLQSLSEGRITYRHLSAIAEQARLLPVEVLTAFEEQALPYAETHTVPATQRQVRVMRERIHPESITERTITALSERRVWMTALPDGMAEIAAIVPALEAQAIMNRVTRISTSQRTGDGETRTLAQLQADVFADLLLGDDAAQAGIEDRAAVTTRISGRIEPQVSVTIPLVSLMRLSDDPAELIGFGPFDNQLARTLAERAPYLRRLITDPFTGQPIALDPRKYRPDKATRDWICLRDRRCRFPGCHRQAEATDIDHGIARMNGGQTTPGNLALLCRHHHRLKDTGGWRVTHSGNGRLTWVSPAGRVYVTEPDGNPCDNDVRLMMETGYTGPESPEFPEPLEPPGSHGWS